MRTKLFWQTLQARVPAQAVRKQKNNTSIYAWELQYCPLSMLI